MIRYRRSIQLPAPHGAVRCTVEHWTDGIAVFYWGTLEQFVAAGCATPAMLAPGRPGRPRKDADGDRVTLQQISGTRYRLMRVKPQAAAPGLPGVSEWLAAYPLRRGDDRAEAFQRFLCAALGNAGATLP